MPFVIRSMSTTNFTPAYRCGSEVIPAQQPKPYHIFLRERSKRAGAYWAGAHEAMKFETVEEAQAEAARANVNGFDIVPHDFAAQGLPAYWEARK